MIVSVTAEQTNLEILKQSRRKLRNGDIFVLRPRGHGYHFGRVVDTNAIFAGVPGVVLFYIYKYSSATKQPPAVLRRDELLLPPMLTNRLPWSRGYFEHVETRDVTPWDVFPVHCFAEVSRPGRYWDAKGRPLTAPTEPLGTYVLKSFLTIDDAVSKALGIAPIDRYLED